MRKYFYYLLLLFINGILHPANSQNIRFEKIIKGKASFWGSITGLAQDSRGYIWFTTSNNGLQRFDGINTKSYLNDARNSNTTGSDRNSSLYIDKDNIIWIGGMRGLDRFDPVINQFTHFRHDESKPSSLDNDTVRAILRDHLGVLWIGTKRGLNRMNEKTGQFTHFVHDPNNPSSLSYPTVSTIYEDKAGTLWIGCGEILTIPYLYGGLNRFNKESQNFSRYLHDPKVPGSLANNVISTIYEDSKGVFWIGTAGDGLHSLDRKTGVFTHYYYNAAKPQQLSRPPYFESNPFDLVSLIDEDPSGTLWIGSAFTGLNSYDRATKKITHHGFSMDGSTIRFNDTLTGFGDYMPFRSFTTKESVFWVSTFTGNLYHLRLSGRTIPFYEIVQDEANTIYVEPNNKIIWIGTDQGLLRRDVSINSDRLYINDPADENSLASDAIYAMKPADNGRIWIGTVGGGLDLFDPVSGKFVHHKNDPNNPNSICSDQVYGLFVDSRKNIWVATNNGLSKYDAVRKLFINYRHIDKDSSSIISNEIYAVTEDREGSIWASTGIGISCLNNAGKFKSYLDRSGLRTVLTDSKGIVWTGGVEGLYFYDKRLDDFRVFADQNSPLGISAVLGLIEDDQHRLWVSSQTAITRINEGRDSIKNFGAGQGLAFNPMGWSENFKGSDGKLYIGHWDGYYEFFPQEIKDNATLPRLNFLSFKLDDKEILPGEEKLLTEAIWNTTEIKLNHKQNNFSFDFVAIDYESPGDEKYFFMLENYDNNWHDIGTDHRAFFFNIPPGNYIFRVKALNSDGAYVEKSIRIIISPPWWKTWWAYGFYAVLLIAAGYLVYRLQRRWIVVKERKKVQEKELAQAKEIEKAYTGLKAAQAQLIQSEKMASLGELTAGIAHEIQNPLNFVNNFSEVSTELVDEMNTEIEKGNNDKAKLIAQDLKRNLEKINHHGIRAGDIVKGMLQHSRASSGVKEPTNINALADEYLRLAYHGLRAKDKSFNVTLETEYDKNIGKINIIPQDIGRVVLNLINNAFYAVDEKNKKHPEGYIPTISVSTKRINDRVEICVADNGNGIPQNVVEKIFQPFFTTKPTGQGTGLGLSLSYDIVKAHGGELKIETVEGEGSTFIIQLPR